MKSSTKMLAKICLIVSAVLCVALIAAQFLPHWHYTSFNEAMEEVPETTSIIKYMAFTYEEDDVTDYLKSQFKSPKDFKINSLASTFCIVVLLGIVSIAFVAVKPNSRWISVFPFAVGIGSFLGYLTEPLWKLGDSYTILLVLSAALAVVAMIPFVIWVASARFWFMDPKKLANK